MAFKIDINSLFKARGITSKLVYLKQNGFSHYEAQNIAYCKLKLIRIEQIYKLCLAFNCTPNDLFSLDESDITSLPQEHPLRSLIREPIPDIPELLKKLPPDKISELSKNIQNLIK